MLRSQPYSGTVKQDITCIGTSYNYMCLYRSFLSSHVANQNNVLHVKSRFAHAVQWQNYIPYIHFFSAEI
jgi:hypothetical protein